MQVSVKSMRSLYENVADTVARLDIDQEERETLAEALTEAFTEARAPRFTPDTFRLIASDPLCACVGPNVKANAEPCPEAREIRVAMHLSAAVDGRSEAWRSRKPEVRCVTCGAMAFVPGYREGREAQEGES